MALVLAPWQLDDDDMIQPHRRRLRRFRGAAAAGRWAADEARRRGASLSVVGCFTVPVMAGEGESDAVFGVRTLDSLRESKQCRVDEVVAELRASHPGVGSTGTGVSPLFMVGSLSHALMGKSVCPVVLVPGVRPMPERPEIVATIDATADWCPVVDWACDAADLVGTRLTIVHGSSNRCAGGMVSDAAGIGRVDEAVMLDRALERAVARTGADVTGRLVEGDTVAKTIASAFAADLVVAGAPSLRRLVPTSTLADVLIAHATCPVAIVASRRIGTQAEPAP